MQNRRFVTLTAALIAALFIATVAQAQDKKERQRSGDRSGQRRGSGGRGFGGPGFGGRFGGPGGGGLLSLLRVEEVRKEIKLDETQEELVKVVEDEVRGDQPERRFDFREATEKEREKYFAERRARAEKQAKAANGMLATVLSKDQMKRLTQINIQLQGVSALSDADVAKKLKLTDKQRQQISKTQRESSDEVRSKMREIFQGGSRGGNFEEIRAKMTALRTEADKKVLAVLTTQQQKQFDEMKGKKFDMPRRGFGGRGGGRGGFGGGRGGVGGRGGRGGQRGGGERKRPPSEP